MDVRERIKCNLLLDVITEDAVDVVKKHIPRKGTVAFSGIVQMATPKVIPRSLASYVMDSGEEFKLNIYTSGSAAPELDGELAKIDVVSRRYAFQNNPVIREKINKGLVQYYDIALGEFSYQLRSGFLDDVNGPIDVAVVEAVGVEVDGSIVPSISVDNTPTFVQLAKKVIVEVNLTKPMDLEGLHDIYIGQYRKPVEVYKVNQRIGTPTIPCDPRKIVAIVPSAIREREVFYGKPTRVEEKIVENLFEFLSNEVAKGRLPKSLYPIQTGIGPVGDLIATRIAEFDFNDLEVWTEVGQIHYIDALESGKLSSISASVLYIPPEERRKEERFLSNLAEYKRKVVLRPLEVTNDHGVIRALNVISMNQAVEVDIYGMVNVTHTLGVNVVNGIGGSVEFARAAYLSIFLLPSTTASGRISRIVPMVTHVDITDHDVDIVVTENGVADLRGLSPRERAKKIIEECASPEYRDELLNYFNEACKKVGGHVPHLLEKAFFLHERYIKTGSMK